MNDRRDHLSRAEITKDAVQSGAEAAAHTVGEVATILTRAVGEVASAVGGFATEIFEIRESSRRAIAEHGEAGELDAGDDVSEGVRVDVSEEVDPEV